MLQKAVGKFFCEVAIEPVSYLVVRRFSRVFLLVSRQNPQAGFRLARNFHAEIRKMH